MELLSALKLTLVSIKFGIQTLADPKNFQQAYIAMPSH